MKKFVLAALLLSFTGLSHAENWQAGWATIDGLGIAHFNNSSSNRGIHINIRWISAPPGYQNGSVVEAAALESISGSKNIDRLYSMLLSAKAMQNHCWVWVDFDTVIQAGRVKIGDVFCGISTN